MYYAYQLLQCIPFHCFDRNFMALIKTTNHVSSLNRTAVDKRFMCHNDLCTRKFTNQIVRSFDCTVVLPTGLPEYLFIKYAPLMVTHAPVKKPGKFATNVIHPCSTVKILPNQACNLWVIRKTPPPVDILRKYLNMLCSVFNPPHQDNAFRQHIHPRSEMPASAG